MRRSQGHSSSRLEPRLLQRCWKIQDPGHTSGTAEEALYGRRNQSSPSLANACFVVRRNKKKRLHFECQTEKTWRVVCMDWFEDEARFARGDFEANNCNYFSFFVSPPLFRFSSAFLAPQSFRRHSARRRRKKRTSCGAICSRNKTKRHPSSSSSSR